MRGKNEDDGEERGEGEGEEYERKKVLSPVHVYLTGKKKGLVNEVKFLGAYNYYQNVVKSKMQGH